MTAPAVLRYQEAIRQQQDLQQAEARRVDQPEPEHAAPGSAGEIFVRSERLATTESPETRQPRDLPASEMLVDESAESATAEAEISEEDMGFMRNVPAIETVTKYPIHSAELGRTEYSYEGQSPEDSLATWAAELNKAPAVIQEDFVQALRALARSTELADNESQNGAELAPQQRVVLRVAERLALLDSETQQHAAELVKNIIGAMHGLLLLEAKGAEAERIAQVKTQLRELCRSLCEAAGLELSEEEFDYFMQAIAQLNFDQSPIAELTEGLDLEHIGTHEAKRTARFFIGDAAGDNYAQKALGMLILTRTGLLPGRVTIV